ncbi:MAG: aminoacyl-tRNA hydrolase [Phycisphaerales bacterium]|nr:MAG: aminoacyl-tRNA hydrolase [Phycisphaerales bacterium]
MAPGVRIAPDAVRFAFTRSTGPGGQNVNKRSTRAEMRIRLDDIPLPPDARRRLVRLAGSRITDDGELILTNEETRSQRRNRDACLDTLRELVVRALVKPKPRKKTKPSKGSVRRRLEEKSQRSEIKKRRQRPGSDGH